MGRIWQLIGPFKYTLALSWIPFRRKKGSNTHRSVESPFQMQSEIRWFRWCLIVFSNRRLPRNLPCLSEWVALMRCHLSFYSATHYPYTSRTFQREHDWNSSSPITLFYWTMIDESQWASIHLASVPTVFTRRVRCTSSVAEEQVWRRILMYHHTYLPLSFLKLFRRLDENLVSQNAWLYLESKIKWKI